MNDSNGLGISHGYMLVFDNLRQFVPEGLFMDVHVMKCKAVEVELGVDNHFPCIQFPFLHFRFLPEDANGARGILGGAGQELAVRFYQGMVYHIYMAVVSHHFCQPRAIDGEGIHVMVPGAIIGRTS